MYIGYFIYISLPYLNIEHIVSILFFILCKLYYQIFENYKMYSIYNLSVIYKRFPRSQIQFFQMLRCSIGIEITMHFINEDKFPRV